MENIAAPGTATPMHFHAEDEFFHILEGTVTFSIDGNVSMPKTWCHADFSVRIGDSISGLRKDEHTIFSRRSGGTLMFEMLSAPCAESVQHGYQRHPVRR